MMNNLTSQIDYIFFFYGASFFVLGAVCMAILRHSFDYKKLPWVLLGFFGFIHAINEWMDMTAICLGDTEFFKLIRLIVLTSSYVCLLEFARRAHSKISGKHVGLGIYVLLFIFVMAGFLKGQTGVIVLIRYSLGFVGAIWTSILFFIFRGTKEKPLSGFLVFSLRTAGVAMFLYALVTGIVVPKASFFPANFINTESFFRLFHIPVQFLRAVFAFVISVSIAIYAINQSTAVFFREESDRKKKLMTIVSILVISAILFFFFLGWLAVESYGKRALVEETESRKLRVKVYSQFVHMVISKLEVVEALARSPSVVNNFSSNMSQANLDVVNERLDRFKISLDADVCYLMDRTGLTLASSNRNSPKSFVGKNYSFRPYFKEAIAGRHAVYLAKGVTSRERGIYVSYPIFDVKGENIIGVAAAKATLDNLGQYFKAYRYVFLVSPEGIIFVSSRPDWTFRSVRNLTPEDKERLRNSMQFGEGPWDNVGFEDKDDAAGMISFRGSRFFFVSGDVDGLPGWKILFMDDKSNVYPVRFMMILILLSFFLLISIILIFVFKVSLDALHISASEALYEALVEGSPDSISLFSKEGRCISINKNGLLMMGWEKEDCLGKLYEELWPEEHKAKVKQAVKAVMEGRQQTFEAVMPKPNGEFVANAVTLAPITEHTGRVKYFIAISRDVTQERRSRERLLYSSKMSTIGALATGVSHEFNNVLEIILGNAEMAYASRDIETMKKALKVIIDSSRRAAWVIKSMLDFSGKSSEIREFTDIAELMKQNLLLLNKVFEANDIVVETHFSHAPRVYCNPGQISQAFVNIMINARDAMRGLDKKKLTISIDYLQDAAEVMVSFQDTGMGISENIKNKLFGPFVTTKGLVGGGEDQQPGVGLGLFVAYGIVKQHDGNITVESEEGKGSKFTIFLPVFSGEMKP